MNGRNVVESDNFLFSSTDQSIFVETDDNYCNFADQRTFVEIDDHFIDRLYSGP